MSWLQKIKIRQRLFVLVFVVALGGLVNIVVVLGIIESVLMAEKEDQSRKLVETAHSLVVAYHARELSGEMTREQAQRQALDGLKMLRYDADSYFWVNDMTPVMVMHPLKPQLDGKSLADFKDPDGVPLFQLMVDKVRREGEGVVGYKWEKSGHEKPQPKVSYVKGFKDWGWMVGSGIYVDDVASRFWNIAYTVGLLTLIIITLLVGLLLVIGKSIVQPIEAASLAMQKVASGKGDLSCELPSAGNDEVAALNRHFNEFLATIRNIVVSCNQVASQLATATEELSATTRENHADAARQQSDTEQVATAVNEMSSSAQEVARNASNAADATRQADASAAAGRDTMKRTVASMQQLARDINNAAEVVDTLKQESESIGSVLGVIRGISEQTNLLALNAAIEAARAGDQGRGFAVVADEVRTLAGRTQESTEEIQAMIESLQEKSGKASLVMQEGRGKTSQTLDQAAEADDSLSRIVELIASITDMNNQISTAATEQSGVAGELDRIVTQISQYSLHQLAGGAQVAEASAELARLGEHLHGLVGQFKT